MKITTLLLCCILALIRLAKADEFKPIYNLSSNDYNKNSAVCCFIDWGASGWIAQSQKFPEAEVFDLSSNKKILISTLVKEKPIVLQMGSLTCPSYDLNIGRIKELQKKYGNSVDFYTLYVRENHPTSLYPAHQNLEQKISFAKKLLIEDKIEQKVLVDDVSGSLHQKLGNFGNSIYLIGKDMHVNHWSIFPNTVQLEKGIEALLSANGIAHNAAYINGSDLHSLLSPEFTQEEKKFTSLKMKSREGQTTPEKSIESINSYYSYLEKNHPEIHGEFNKKQWDTMKDLSVFSLTHDMNKKRNKKTWNIIFLSMHEEFRNFYKFRYNKWKKLNNVTTKEDVAAQTLIGHNPVEKKGSKNEKK